MNIYNDTTIAALATPAGEGGIAIIRLSGDKAESILSQAFRKKGKKWESHRLYYGHAVDADGGIIDEAMAVLMRAPHSYTREDVAELHCHGGSAVAEKLLDRLMQLGAVPAQPGEFTKRAFLNGRIDLSRSEAVMSLIRADSDAARRAAIRELEGGVTSFVRQCRDRLTKLLSLIEASNDYPDEIDEPATAEQVHRESAEIAAFLRENADPDKARLVTGGVSVVLSGRPNAGKSSLLNALTGTERAIVTDIPGTTRDVLTEHMTIGTLKIELSDTAGQHETGDAIEAMGVERAKTAQRNADIVLIVIDASEPLTDEDRRLLKEKDERSIVVCTKTDRPVQTDIGADVMVSSVTGEGIDELLKLIRKKAGADRLSENMLTGRRQIECALRAAEALERGSEAAISGMPLDMAAADIWEARSALGEITGEDARESVIDAVFSNFCVGK